MTFNFSAVKTNLSKEYSGIISLVTLIQRYGFYLSNGKARPSILYVKHIEMHLSTTDKCVINDASYISANYILAVPVFPIFTAQLSQNAAPIDGM